MKASRKRRSSEQRYWRLSTTQKENQKIRNLPETNKVTNKANKVKVLILNLSVDLWKERKKKKKNELFENFSKRNGCSLHVQIVQNKSKAAAAPVFYIPNRIRTEQHRPQRWLSLLKGGTILVNIFLGWDERGL